MDVLAPSIYPRGSPPNVTAQAAWTASVVSEAIRSANLVGSRRLGAADAAGAARPRPAVYPYARAFVQGGEVLSRGILAAGIQVAAGLGAEGLVLWGSTEDYAPPHGSCGLVEGALNASGGALVRGCVRNRAECAARLCSGHGRCVDYSAARLEQTCLEDPPASAVRCRCDQGFSGARCEMEG